MIDERELREMLERRAGTISATPTDAPKAVRRARRRLVLNAAVGTVVGFVVLVGALAGVRAIQTAAPIPADPPVEPRPAPAAAGTLTYILDGDIYVADPDGSNAVKIANGLPNNECDRGSVGEEYWAEGSMWSPDGRYIAYRHTECSDPEFRGGVVISDAEGNVIATFPTGAGWGIAWSPDSSRVAVWDAFGGGTIGVYGLDGTRQTQLTMPPGWTPSGDHEPVWMPDGTSVWIDGWALPVDGSTPRPLPLGSDPYPTFSPDGSLVAYSDNRSLMVARSDGSEPREVFGGWAEYSAWSPTGDRIAFSDGESLRLLDVATGEVTRLTEGERGTSLRVMGFSPEGDRVLFSTIESDSLWSIGVDGSDASLVVAGTWQGEWLSLAPQAVPSPVPTVSSPSPDDDWPLERIRAEGSPLGEPDVTESGIRYLAYVVCDGPRSACDSEVIDPLLYQHAALEVTQDGQSALFTLGANYQYALQEFDAHSVFVMDDPRNDAWGQYVGLRYRVLRADGSEVQLQLLDDLVPAIPGPDVFVIDFDSALGGLGGGYGAEAVYLVDLHEGTLQPLDVPDLGPAGSFFSRYWGPNVDEFLWFVDPNCRVGWATDDTFEKHRLDCAEGLDRPMYIYDAGFPNGWLQPGRMAAVARTDDGRLFLYVSLDYGSTWQEIPVSDEAAIAGVLEGLG